MLRKSKVSVTCLALALSGAMTTGVQAGDWNGMYGGITLGAGPVEFVSACTFDYSDCDVYKPSTTSIGGLVGYNSQIGNVILGLEGEYTAFNGADYNLSSSDNFNSNLHQNELTAAASLRARLGFEVTETVMVYSSVGMARFMGTVTSSDVDYGGDYSVNAFEFGFGAEAMVMENNSVRAGVYTVADFEVFNTSGGDVMSEGDAMSMNRISLAVAYHF